MLYISNSCFIPGTVLRAVSAALHLILMQYPPEAGSSMIVKVKMRTLRLREVKWLPRRTKVVMRVSGDPDRDPGPGVCRVPLGTVRPAPTEQLLQDPSGNRRGSPSGEAQGGDRLQRAVTTGTRLTHDCSLSPTNPYFRTHGMPSN